eukprot:759897-Hanusia_phi.AAC.5
MFDVGINQDTKEDAVSIGTGADTAGVGSNAGGGEGLEVEDVVEHAAGHDQYELTCSCWLVRGAPLLTPLLPPYPPHSTSSVVVQ